MVKTRIRGTQIKDRSVTSHDLASDSVITEKILDHNVTEPKLAIDISSRLLSSASVIGRAVIGLETSAGTDILIPNGLEWDSATQFVERFLIILNGVIQYSGPQAPTVNEPYDCYPGGSSTTMKFSFDLEKNSRIQVVKL